MSAILSDCGTYRYALWRDIPQPLMTDDQVADLPLDRPDPDSTVLFVMLNPSTADAALDDPTIRRCASFARDWGYARLAVANLYAFRATQPHELAQADDPIGPENDDWIATLCNEADCKIAAWGASVHAAPERVQEVAFMLDHDTVFCLGLTAEGHPKHPLYVPADVAAIDYRHPALYSPALDQEES